MTKFQLLTTAVISVWCFCGVAQGYLFAKYAVSNGHEPLTVIGAYFFGFMTWPFWMLA